MTVTDILLGKMETNSEVTFWNADIYCGGVFGVSVREFCAGEQWQG